MGVLIQLLILIGLANLDATINEMIVIPNPKYHKLLEKYNEITNDIYSICNIRNITGLVFSSR